MTLGYPLVHLRLATHLATDAIKPVMRLAIKGYDVVVLNNRVGGRFEPAEDLNDRAVSVETFHEGQLLVQVD